MKVIILLTLSGWVSACGQYPKDMRGTLKKVEHGTIVVGVTENPPYVIYQDGKLSGTDIELVQAFAKDLNANVEWVNGPESTVMTLLKEGQIDVAAGGFNQRSIWKKEVYFVRPYDTLQYKWGVPANTSLPQDLKERQVYVRRGSVAGAYVHQAKGKVVYKDALTGNEPLVVAASEVLSEMGYQTSEAVLQEDKKSLAIQKRRKCLFGKIGSIYSYL